MSTSPETNAGQATPAQQTVTIDDSQAATCYMNFCRVTTTTEEFVLDLGFNPHPAAGGHINVKVSQRIVMNPYWAKRLATALATAVQRHEQTFGMLETDPKRRARATGRGE